jgi:hypothetical protein
VLVRLLEEHIRLSMPLVSRLRIHVFFSHMPINHIMNNHETLIKFGRQFSREESVVKFIHLDLQFELLTIGFFCRIFIWNQVSLSRQI